MRLITSALGEQQTVSVRRSESSDAEGINALLQLHQASSVFGRINVLHMLEKANLAVSLVCDRGEVLAHASFLDHPVAELVDQAEWEPFVQRISGSRKYKPVNTLFLRLFVSEPTFAAASSLEIMRAVFSAVPELQFILLLSPHLCDLDPGLLDVFEPLESQTELNCVAQVCVRDKHCPKLTIRPARVEDHDDVMKVFSEQTTLQLPTDRPFFMSELIEVQSELQHTAVCESNGTAVGFISVTARVNVKYLLQQYDLSECEGVFTEPQGQSERRERETGQSERRERQTGQSERRERETGQSERRERETDQSGGTKEKSAHLMTTEDEKGQSNATKTQQPEQTEKKTVQSGQTQNQTDQTVRRRKEPAQTEAQTTDQSEVREETGHAPSEQVKKPEEERAEETSHAHKAFCINFFAIDKNHESRSVDFLPYLFGLFPDRDLCLISLSSLAPELPLLHSFTRVSPKNICAPPHELYALHRLALRPVQVRRAVPSDRDLILDLVRGLDHREFLFQDLDQFYQTEMDQDRVPLQCFVAQVGTRLVGAVVIRDEQDVEFLRAHYNIENFIYFSHHSYQEHAALRHFVLRSSVRHCSRLVFREVLRLSHKSCLYLRVYPRNSPESQTCCIHPLDFLLDCAVPVRPRPQMDYPLEELGLNAPSNHVTDPQPPFALHLVSRKLTLEQKVVVNARIVVCGASDTGLSLMETLCCCPHLRFNSLTLVSTHGFPGDTEDQHFLSTSHAYSSTDLALLPLSAARSVCGKVASIDRKSKHVQVCSDRKSTPLQAPSADWLPYDILVLCSGLQYQAPALIGSGPVPLNLWTLHDPEERVRARRWVQEQLQDQGTQEHVVVFGHSVDAFAAVQALLSLGLPGPRIHLVLAPSESGSWLPDPAVERAVDLNLHRAQVQVYKNCLLRDISIEENRVSAATFSCTGETLEICCGVLVTLSCLGLDPLMRRSVLDSFLVLDGRLVIDGLFHTMDPWIFAAGTITKFSRRFYSDEWNHQHFCSREVGQDVARQVLLLFDPTAEPREERELLPVYKRPKVTGGILPGGLHFLHVTKPTPSKHSSVQHLKDSALVTGRAESGSYFRLQFGDLEQVESVTCASAKPLPLHNLLCLYGQQQRLLGNLSTRFSLGQVPDLYSFFRQSWCLAIFHDRFSDFQQELRAMANHSAAAAKVKKAEQASEGEEEEEELLDAEARAAVRSAVVKYLSYNQNLLPMFALPGQL